MLNDYKKKFVLFNMFLIGIVLFVMLSTVFIYSYRTDISDLKMTMAHLTKPVENSPNVSDSQQESFSKPKEQENPSSKPDVPKPKEDEKPRYEPDSKTSRDNGMEKNDVRHDRIISIFFYDAGSGKLSLISRSFISDEEALVEIAEKISASSEEFGQLREHNLYYYKTQSEDFFRIAVANANAVRNSAIKIFILLLLIFLCAMLFFYLVSIQFSKYAVRPLEEEMKREKQFVADTSHDLKTPIAVIRANMDILKHNREESVGELLQWVDGTAAAAQNMQLLIEEMLTLSDVEAAGNKIELEMIDISDVAERVSLFMEPIAYEKNIRYETDIAKNISVYGNGNYIQRIFQTFIENAVKYEPTGGKVVISMEKKCGRAVFLVHNMLSVIEEKNLPYIFERFYRSDKSRQSNGGHGLGLAIAKSMADVMGASVKVESSECAGTTFQVEF